MSPHPEGIDPDTLTDEFYFLDQPGQADIQTDFFLTIRTTYRLIEFGKNGFVIIDIAYWNWGRSLDTIKASIKDGELKTNQILKDIKI